MSNHQALTEEPLQFGEGGRLFGILTRPDETSVDPGKLPVFVFLSAGLLHRVGPHRLHVRLARELAGMGFCSLRVDLAGNGDSVPRPGLTNQQSVAADYAAIVDVLESHLGSVTIVLAGLCSGADNAIRLALADPRVVGMVLLDPVCDPDDGFRARAVGFGMRAFARKCMTPARYMQWVRRRIKALTGETRHLENPVDYVALRDLPTRDQMRAAFTSIGERRGRVLTVFTGYALPYCNQRGQMGRVLNVESYRQFCTELFWPHAEHTYTLELHRRRLIEEIRNWASAYLHPGMSTSLAGRPADAPQKGDGSRDHSSAARDSNGVRQQLAPGR